MVTMFLVSDPDAGDTHSFALLGNPGQKFSLSTQGQLSVAKGIQSYNVPLLFPENFTHLSVSPLGDEQRRVYRCSNTFVVSCHRY